MKRTIQVMLEESDIKILKKLAKESGHSLSGFIRYVITKFTRGKNGGNNHEETN